MTIGERIKQRRLELGLTVEQVSKSLGKNRATIYRYECDYIYQLPITVLEPLAKVLQCTPAYLMGWEEESNKISSNKGMKIPVLGRVQAGLPIEAVEEIIDYEKIPEAMAKHGEYFALKIKGSSMEPRIKENDVVIVKKESTIDNGDIAIVIVNSNDATCKKVSIQPSGITLIPLNPSYEPIFYSAEQINSLPVRILGKVVELRAKF